jgi:predicted ATPase with chaperone activity
MHVGEIRQFCRLQDEGQSLTRAAMTQLNLSPRAYHRTQSVKLARTIAVWHGVRRSNLCIWQRHYYTAQR